MKVRHFTASLRHAAPPHEVAVVVAGKRRVEITESPTGRSVQVWVDGERVHPRSDR